jgi:hypothetical protein
LGEACDQPFDVVTEEGFAASEAEFLDAQICRKADDAFDFFEAEQVGFGHPLLDNGGGVGHVCPVPAIEVLGGFGFREAIETAEIAAVGQANSQVAQNASMRVD